MKKILIIDDEVFIRNALSRLLSDYALLTAEDGEDGYAKYKEHRPDLAIVDLKMPKKNGLETIKEIFAFDPNANIIILTGYNYLNQGAQDTDPLYSVKQKIKAFFDKPVDPQELIKKIEDIIN